MQRPHILVSESEGFSPRAAELLRQAGELTLADLDYPGLLSRVGDVDVLWVRLRHRIDRTVLSSAPHLKMIATPTTGLNHVDIEEARRRRIQIVSLRGEQEFLKNVRATAEHAVGLMLALLRNVPGARASVLAGGWDRDLFRGQELYGTTAGVIGYGRLGRIVSRYLRAFDVTVLTSDPHVAPDTVPPDISLVPLDDLLLMSDIVTVHVSLSTDTDQFFGSRQFNTMKRGAWFINTSRGELVNEGALLNALESGHLSGAATDVLANEQSSGMGDHPLVRYAREHDNLLITPHIGGCTVQSMEKTECFLARKVADTLKEIAP